MAVTIRRAEPAESEALSALALSSKAHWGYDSSFLAACRAELTVAPGDVERLRITVAEEAAEVVGFYGLGGGPPEGELCFFFVEPARIGTGVGRALWKHCLATAARVGLSRIRIESDPFAEGFYLAMGATRSGDAPSASIPDRTLPLLTIDLGSVSVELHPVDELARSVERVLEELRGELRVLVPGVEVEHVGATSLPDGFTKGDIDVNLRVQADRFEEVVGALSASFESAQPGNWTPTYASFSGDRRGMPLGIQVTVAGSGDDFLVALRDRLRDDPAMRHRYDQIKRETAPAGRDAYWQAKDDFLRGVRNATRRP